MNYISEKTLIDLEFFTVLETVASFCVTSLGKKAALDIRPIGKKEDLLFELKKVDEYLSSFQNDNRIPNHYFDDIQKEIHLLQIENSFLEPASFLKVLNNLNTFYELHKFLKKFKEIYSVLFEEILQVPFEKETMKSINKIISPYGEVLDGASVLLKQIRKEIQIVRSRIGSSFKKALSKYSAAGYLDEILESIVDNQQVLAVQAMHRKKVKGSLLGSSKTGSIVYIAPEATLSYSRELQNLMYDEHQEVIRILKTLTDDLRPYADHIQALQFYLTNLDTTGARARYAKEINGCLPKISSTKKLNLRKAYHPILWLTNKEQKLATIPQTILLDKNQQIIVISGPNAGGKSITLKTVGLLQVMLQSGLLIPVDERSETYIFEKILTDIGDNQSIENQLSTYSYRLKNMRNFLRKCNDNTLFLIDEFGTGSDPELGGALAEIFLEEFHSRKAFGIITTHYANLKVLASEMENVVNANMHFDENSMKPLFKLFIGQAGSSFTFEVAQKNGIPFRLINRAKKRVEGEKVRLDKTIAKLQKERSNLQKNSNTLQQEKSKVQEQTESLSQTHQKVQEKLEGFQELYDSNQKMLSFGRKFNELLNTYLQTNNKKQFNIDLNKWLQSEKAKYLKRIDKKPVTKAEKQKVRKEKAVQKKKLETIEKEVTKAVEVVRKKRVVEAKQKARKKADYTFKVNDKVRIIDSDAIGVLERIEKKKAFINYGVFTTETTLQKLELVSSAKS